MLLSSIIGIDFRTTMDMDYCLKNIPLTEENLKLIINEIINIKIDDGVTFKFIDTDPIRQQDEYGGYRFNLVAELENMRVNLSIDIATGDVITPKEITYFYPCIFEDKKLPISAYNVETIIAEKLLAVTNLKGLNSRTKDFYDLFFLFSKNEEYFKTDIAKNAVKNTFKRRSANVKEILEVVNSLYENRFLKERWQLYKKKYKFVNDVNWQEVLDVIKNGVEKLEL